MKKRIIVILVIVLPIAIVLLNPLRRSEDYIENYILRQTPIGTSMEDVIKVIEKKRKWEVWYIDRDTGFRLPSAAEDTFIGEKSIGVHIGDYRNLFVTSVTVLWGFDQDSKLIDVYIWKTVDSL